MKTIRKILALPFKIMAFLFLCAFTATLIVGIFVCNPRDEAKRKVGALCDWLEVEIKYND